MTAPKIDTQAPDYKGFTDAIMEGWAEHGDVDAFTKFELAIRHNILREIPGGFNPDQHDDVTGSCPEAGDLWYEMNDAPDLSAAREAAAWIEGRDAAVRLHNDLWRETAAYKTTLMRAITPPADPAAALDRLIAERVREAAVVLTECLDWMESLRASTDAGFWDWQEGDAYTKGRAFIDRASKEGRP